MNDIRSASPADLEVPTKVRYGVLGFACSLSMITYLDRVCFAYALKPLQEELGLASDADLKWALTAFTIAYAAFEIPTGWLGDVYGPRKTLIRIVLWWSFFTALTGCVYAFTLDSGLRLSASIVDLEIPLVINAFVVLLLIRFLFGAGEAGAYPNIAKCSARWFPLRQRGFAQGIVATAGRIGGGIAPGITMAVTALGDRQWPGMGWRIAFWVFGLLGLFWMVLFAAWFRNSPAEHPSVNKAELDLIAEGPTIESNGALPEPEHGDHPPGTPWAFMLTRINLWFYCLMGLCSAFVVYLYFTHFPSYLEERHHVPKSWGVLAGLPMLGGAMGCTLGGFWTDWLVRRTGSKRWSRRIPGMLGKGTGAVLLLAGATVNDPVWAVVLITLSAFAADLSVASQWAVCSDVGGRYVGTLFGIMNSVAGIGAVASPILAGYIIEGMSPTGVGGVFDDQARGHAWDLVLYMFAGTLALCALSWLGIDADRSMVEHQAEPG